jgi:hypothetical protein
MADHVIPYPFVRCKVEIFDGEGPATIDSWRPGTEDWSDYYHERRYADAMGTMTLTEVSRHKPGKYPERVFYTRKFTTPDGTTFGKGALRVTTAGAFKRLCAGFRHKFDLDPTPTPEGGG